MAIRSERKLGLWVLSLSLALLALSLASVFLSLPQDRTSSVECADHPMSVPHKPDPDKAMLDTDYPPVAIVKPNEAEVLVGERLVLSARDSFDPDGTIVEFQWIFQPGASVIRPEVTVVFMEPGSRTVTLTVVDNDGFTNSSLAFIEVLPKTPEPILILTAGPDNILHLEAGSEGVIILDLVAYNQQVSDLEVEILDDGGLDVSIEHVPSKVKPGRPEELRIRIGAPELGDEELGSTILLRVVSDSTVSNVEHIDVMVRTRPSLKDFMDELVQISVVIVGVVVLSVLLAIWKRRR